MMEKMKVVKRLALAPRERTVSLVKNLVSIESRLNTDIGTTRRRIIRYTAHRGQKPVRFLLKTVELKYDVLDIVVSTSQLVDKYFLKGQGDYVVKYGAGGLQKQRQVRRISLGDDCLYFSGL